MDSLVQQQVHHDIQPQEIATELKTLVLKHRILQVTKEGDKNHNVAKKGKILCINFIEENTPSVYQNTKDTQRRMTIWYRMPQRNTQAIHNKKMQRMVSQSRTGANLVVSQIQAIGNLYKVQKRSIYR